MRLPARSSQNGFTHILILGIIALVLVGGVGGWIFSNVLNKPAVIKQHTEDIQPNFTALTRSIEDLADNILDSPTASDADSVERYAKKSADFNKAAIKDTDALSNLLDKLNMSETKDYKENLTKYLTTSRDIIKYGEDNAKFNQEAASLRRDYELLVADLNGVSSYITSNPDKYVQIVSDSISKEEKITKGYESMSMQTTEYKDSINTTIKLFKLETNFLQSMVTGVKNRNSETIVNAQKTFSAGASDLAKDSSRSLDSLKSRIDDLKRDLSDTETKVTNSYNSLKSDYKF